MLIGRGNWEVILRDQDVGNRGGSYFNPVLILQDGFDPLMVAFCALLYLDDFYVHQ